LVAGAATFLAESRAQRHLPKLKGATLKALLMSTAWDIGVPGPDPVYGFGTLQVSTALRVCRTDHNASVVKEVTVTPGGAPVAFQVKALPRPNPSDMRLKVFICWDDPEFAPSDETLNKLDDPVKTLVHDLDLVVTHVEPADPDPYEPVAINLGTGPKTFSVNHKDNVECVEVYDEGIFNIEVKYTGILTGPQPVSIIVQGADTTWKQTSPAPTTPPAPGVTPPSPKSTVINQTGANEYTLTWPSVCGRVYNIESSPDLVNWTPVVSEVKANGWYTSYPVARLSGDRGFYRVKDVNDPEILDPVELAPIEGIEEE
jgi:hypothetical protein